MVLLKVNGELVGITAGVVDPVAPSEQANKQTTIFGSGMKFYRRRQSFATSNKQHDESVEPMWCVEPAFLCAAATATATCFDTRRAWWTIWWDWIAAWIKYTIFGVK
uniref:Uncharacterized protein n=1 Tax=Grammatophora oceanica TaxID=210454 RepID=A0A6U5MN18_9STRA|mmetsp:Transcript_3811/g.5201  ORF Transcript_3811/g.5201 Transcript_3811/m.5201 type:complete len:107 (+) Transcript_3811:540-860(+)